MRRTRGTRGTRGRKKRNRRAEQEIEAGQSVLWVRGEERGREEQKTRNPDLAWEDEKGSWCPLCGGWMYEDGTCVSPGCPHYVEREPMRSVSDILVRGVERRGKKKGKK